MIKTYPLNPRRLERLLTVLVLRRPEASASEEELRGLLPSLASYDTENVYPSLPPEVHKRILRNVLQVMEAIRSGRSDLIERLSGAIQNRPFSAMYPIDQALLLLGAYELEYNQSEPKIIVKEILICSDTLGNQKAGAYLSGILKTLAFADSPRPPKPPKPQESLHEKIAGKRPPKIFLRRSRDGRQD